MGGTEVNGLMVFNSSGYTVLVHVNVAHIYYYKSLFLHTEEATGKIRKNSAVDFAEIKNNGKFEDWRTSTPQFVFTISHMDSLLSTCIKKVGSLDQFLRN